MSRVLAKRALVPHPDTPDPDFSVGAKLSLIGSDVLKIDYVVTGPVGRLAVPDERIPARKDGLWQASCFEAFVRSDAGQGYAEYNFSPSRCWASYWFDGYREGMAPMADSQIEIFREAVTGERLALTILCHIGAPWGREIDPLRAQWGLSAILEHRDGAKSYWALAHAPGKPDFHHPACFALQLTAPDAP